MQRIITAALAVAFLGAPLAAQTTTSTDDNFKWSGKMSAGSWLSVNNMNGSISVEKASGDVAEVTAVKDWKHGDPKDVTFAIVKDGDNITICALWGDRSTCDANGSHYHGHNNWSDHDNDVNVKFTIRLPAGVKVAVNTVNGSLDVAGAQSEVKAETVNGRINASSSGGPVSANTVNGSIEVSMNATGSDDLKFSTVNGSISVTVPSTFAADLDMETVNGSLTSDFPLTINGRVNPKHLHAVIGSGGRQVKLETVNGSIEIRKGS